MIVLIPTHGLCNRMRAIDSVLGLNEYLNKEIKIIWEKNIGLNCDFETLFIPVKNLRSINGKSFYSRLCQLKKNAKFLGFIFKQLERMELIRVLDQENMNELIQKGFDFKKLKEYKLVIIRTNNRFFKSDTFYKDFLLQPSISNQLEEATKGFSANTIGVHIRRTDNKISIQNSPLELIESKMLREIENNKGTDFFLATDSEKVKSEIISRFGNRIVFFESKLTRSSKDGIIDAVLELYALSRTKKIIGSYWSSYSITAAQLGSIELEIPKI